MIWLVPLALVLSYVTSTLDPVMSVRTMTWGVIVLLLAFATFIFRKGEESPSFPLWLTLSIGLYTAVSVVSAIYAQNTAEAIFDALKITLAFSSFALIYRLLTMEVISVVDLARGVVFGGTAILAVGFYDLFAWFSEPNWKFNQPGAVKSLMANKNLLASALFITLPFAFRLMKDRTTVPRILVGSYIAACLCLIFFTQSRGVWVALAIAGIVFGIFYFARKSTSEAAPIFSSFPKQAIIAVIALVASCGVLYFAPQATGYGDMAEVNDEGGGMASTQKGSIAKRFDMWAHTTQMIDEAPIGGNGLASWKILIPRYGQFTPEGEQGIRYSQRPHNDFLWVWAESGIVALLAYLLIFLLTSWYLISLSLRGESRMPILMLAALLGYCAIAFFSFPRERIFHQVVLMAFLAWAAFEYHQAYKLRTLNMGTGLFSLKTFFIAALGAFAVYVGYKRFDGERLTREIYELNFEKDQAQQQGDAEQVRRSLGAMVRACESAMSTYYTVDPVSTPILWYQATALYELEKLPEAQEAFEEALNYNPNHMLVHNDLGSCYAVQGHYDKAIEQYKQALEISPRFAESLCNLAALYQNQGNNQLAFETLYLCPVDVELPLLYEKYASVIVGRKLYSIRETANPEKGAKIADLLRAPELYVRDFKWCVRNNKDFIEFLEERDWILK